MRLGGKQPVMRTTVWNGQRQDMVVRDGSAKGVEASAAGEGNEHKETGKRPDDCHPAIS